MSPVGEFIKFARPGRLYLAALTFCWGVFCFFTVYQILRKDAATQDPEKLRELQNAARFAPAPMARSSSDDWPQWRGPGRNGVSMETGLLVTWPEGGPRKLWEQPSGEGFSAVAVAQGRVYSIVQDMDHEAIVCWDAETGRELWRHRYPASFRNEFGNGPRATPTIDGDLLFAVGATGIMTCLKIGGKTPEGDTQPALTPEVLWTKPLLEYFGADNLKWGTSFSPLVDQDLVYINPGGPGGRSLAAVEKFTGAVRWQTLDDTAGYGSPVLADCAGERQVVFFTERGLVAVTPDQGKLLWRYPWQTYAGANIATPIVVGDYVFISSGYGNGCALVKIDKTAQGLTANLVYKNRKMQTHFSTCVAYKDHVYGFNDTTLTCMEFRTGKVAWTERGFDKGTLTIADGYLFILGEYGILAVAEASPEGYREQSRFTFSVQRCWTVPVIANGRMYVRDQEKIACYDLKKN